MSDSNIFQQELRRLGSQQYNGQLAVVVDIDDVLARFREGFFGWLNRDVGFFIDHETDAYFRPGMSMRGGETIQQALDRFSDEGGMLSLATNDNVVDSLRSLSQAGVWIHLITARPGNNDALFRETLTWLATCGVPYNTIDFASSKFETLATKQWHRQGKVIYAVDDAPENVMQYAANGVFVYVPKRGYNSGIEHEMVVYFDWEKESLPFAAPKLNT